MEKFSIEIETKIGWVNYHNIMRPGEERAQSVLEELRDKFPEASFRIVKWTGSAV